MTYINNDMTDEVHLFRAYQKTKDINIRNQLAEKYLFIAEIMAKKYANKGVDYDDLMQTSSLALLKAIDRYDVDKGVKFSTFATPSVIGEIKNYFRDKSRLINPGRKNNQLIMKIKGAAAELYAKNNKEPSLKEIAEYINEDLETVIEAMEYTSSVISLDASMEDNETSLYEVIPDSKNIFEIIDDKDALDNAIRKLSDDERRLLDMRYNKNMSQTKVAEKMNVSQMFVSRLERKIIKKLKNILETA
jgi:RNA polymerase sigma-B factor